MLLLAILVFLSAVAIAGCAAYFSIIGLTLLFVGSGISIIVMGSALELGKLITVSFLHQQWEKIGFLLKTYMILACLVLSAITSVGIYGFLAAGYNVTSVKVKGYEQAIENNNNLILQLKTSIKEIAVEPNFTKEVDTINLNKDKYVQQQLTLIEQKQKRITELQNTIAEETKKQAQQINDAKVSLESESKKELEQIKLFNDRLVILDREVQTWMEQGTGGLFKQNGLDKARQVKTAQEGERIKIDEQIKSKQSTIEQLRNDYTTKEKVLTSNLSLRIKTIEDKIQEIEREITNSKKDINSYIAKANEEVAQFSVVKESKLQAAKGNVRERELEIQKLESNNLTLQTKILETDVGTFKFVAKSIGLGLDQTVNWFIWSIMFVFDPLAVTLIICFNHLLKNRKSAPLQERLDIPLVAKPITTPSADLTTTTVTTTTDVPTDDPTHPDQYGRLMRIMAKQRGE